MLTTGGFGLEADPSSAGDLYSAAADAAVAAMKGRLANKFYMLAEEAWALLDEWTLNFEMIGVHPPSRLSNYEGF